MRNYLPSKRFVVFLGLILTAVVIIFLLSRLESKKETFQQKNLVLNKNPTLKDIIEKDSDNDGLPDWEEALWGTDPNLKDTNGDGISDLIEITQKKKNLQINSSPKEQVSELNETEVFARNLFTTVAALKQAGQFNEKSVADLSAAFTQSILENSLTDAFALSDLKKVASTKENNQAYLENINKLTENYRHFNLGSELEILGNAVQKKDEKDVAQLKDMGEAYQKFGAELSKIEVPEEIAENHLVMVNSAIKMGGALVNLAQVFTNPLNAIKYLPAYKQASEDFQKSIDDLGDFITKNELI